MGYFINFIRYCLSLFGIHEKPFFPVENRVVYNGQYYGQYHIGSETLIQNIQPMYHGQDQDQKTEYNDTSVPMAIPVYYASQN